MQQTNCTNDFILRKDIPSNWFPLFSLIMEGKYNNYQALTDRMIKKIIISATAAIVLAISWQTTAAGQSPWISNDTLAHNLVWEDRLYRQVEFLSGSLCEGRATGSAGGCEAAFWIIRNFRKSGLLDSGPGYARHIYAGDGIAHGQQPRCCMVVVSSCREVSAQVP